MSSRSIAVVGSGISGLSAAWLLSRAHDVTLFEKDVRPGGHSNTLAVNEPQGEVPIDTGFIVYNVAAYPNLVALFEHLNAQLLDRQNALLGDGALTLSEQWDRACDYLDDDIEFTLSEERGPDAPFAASN